jgi:uncharacterized protein involved in outer membrane biogenesis
MKKILVKILIGIVVLVIIAVVAISFTMNSIVKKGIEIGGPKMTKVDVKLDSVSVSLLSGKGEIRGLVIGNPEGYKTESAIKLGQASVQIRPFSLFSDKIVVKSVNIQAPDITFEGGLTGNNLTKILANVEAATGEQKSAAKKIQVDELVLRDGKLHVSLNLPGFKVTTVNLPNIELKDLGAGSDGITPAELTKRILQAVVTEATKVVITLASELGKGATDAVKAVGEQAGDAAQKAQEKVGTELKNLLKKNP